MNQPIFWIGCKESEIIDCNNFFSGSITIFGSGKENNKAFDQKNVWRYDYNQDNLQWNSFVQEAISEICTIFPNAQFMLYYPDEIFAYGNELPKRLVCQNDKILLDIFEDKHRTRNWLSECVPILPYLTRMGSKLKYEEICQAFPDFTEFVAQEVYSCGGSGTYFISSDQDCKKYINNDKIYSISPYMNNSCSPNIHIIIYENEIMLLPMSIQLFSPGPQRFHYQGADFPLTQHLSKEIKRKIADYAQYIGERLRFAGYRGICGIDFLVYDSNVYLMEINARFQSSTFLINKALKNIGIDCSMQVLHMDAFLNPSCTFEIPEFQVPYSFWNYTYDSHVYPRLQYIYGLHKSISDLQCLDDNLNWNMKLEQGTYLFKSIFHGSIAAFSPELRCRLHCNINLESLDNIENNFIFSAESAIALKIMLLNHGVRISKNALEKSLESGGFNFEEFEAVDMVINKQFYVNVPYEANCSQLSPFEVDINKQNQYQLLFFGNVIANIDLRYVDNIAAQMTMNGFLYSDIAYQSNDRLRIYHRAGCFFKENKIGCKFCDIEETKKIFSISDLKEVINSYKFEKKIRHYLIGGGSARPDSDFTDIIKLAIYIRDTTHKPIYLMSLPPIDTSVLIKLKEAGVTDVAFNLELFDRQLAKKYMPGKGQISLNIYKSAFKEATLLWGKRGNVRTIFIVGLESKESLLAGIEWVCQMGVSPILSLFKPIKGTALSHLLPPSDAEIIDIYKNTLKICQKYGVELGPSCHYCEDNTLKVSLE
jgi:hypothetical protein